MPLSPEQIKRRNVLYQIKSRMKREMATEAQIEERLAAKRATFEALDNYVPSVCGKRSVSDDVENMPQKVHKVAVVEVEAEIDIEPTAFEMPIEMPASPLPSDLDEAAFFAHLYEDLQETETQQVVVQQAVVPENDFIFDELDLEL